MRYLALLATLLLACLTPCLALAGGGLTIDPAGSVNLVDCAAGGSASTTLLPSQGYLMRITGADTTLCWAPTCAPGGDEYPVGTVVLVKTPANGNPPTNSTISCRSATSTGDVRFARVSQ
jgi:hypothetical protein